MSGSESPMCMLGLKIKYSERTNILNCWAISPALKTILEVKIDSCPYQSTFKLNNDVSNESIQQSLMGFFCMFFFSNPFLIELGNNIIE